MKIMILGLNYAPEKVGIAVYTSGMAAHLVEMGHEVHVVTGQPYYPGWHIMNDHRAILWKKRTEEGVHVTHCPHYIPARPSGRLRILHHASFAISCLVPTLYKTIHLRPHWVITIAPSLLSAPVALLAAWISGSKSWLHIQDFEIEAAFATELLAKHGLAARSARWFEQRMLKAFRRVSTISPQMCLKLAEKGVKPERIREFRNWADITAVYPLETPSPYLAEWGIKTPHVALYSGNIGNKQGIEIIIEAARMLVARQDLTFVICGEGPNRAALESLALNLPNIHFFDLQPKERLGELLNLATIHLMPQIKDAADLVLPSKLTNMLSSGRPVVASTPADSGLALEVADCGIVTEPDNPTAFAEAIAKLADCPSLHASYAKNARTRAEVRWNGLGILAEWEKELHCKNSESPKTRDFMDV
ncbi:WcaI family glycosyltransferase [Thalassospira marina]|uniref:Colanic acid biosynthesis glycosyltransferase WcaI n=1 Tax=Thalassospira marina TaxID=2048283 RepID=A0ABN5FKW4_9PROT|nr:WcaI family glycosyltransferase [Thalassospira marina]AUG54539.1 colanic acid biosynthesis glycosyltransferase WcaI [Thalassospira marina]